MTTDVSLPVSLFQLGSVVVSIIVGVVYAVAYLFVANAIVDWLEGELRSYGWGGVLAILGGYLWPVGVPIYFLWSYLTRFTARP